MRIIKFRAKMKNKNKWVVGDLLHPTNCDNSYSIYEFNGGAVKVKPETISQFTGRYDKNGKEIWENDIVKENNCVEEIFGVVKFCTEDVASCGSCCYPRFEGSGFKADEIALSNSEVVGNIFDNKELLGEQQ